MVKRREWKYFGNKKRVDWRTGTRQHKVKGKWVKVRKFRV